jgi:hypothetical protein
MPTGFLSGAIDGIRMPESRYTESGPVNRSSLAQILLQIIDFLEVDGPVLLAPEVRHRSAEAAGDLLERARKPGEILYVGILGGTGVGKSTLINALARDEISFASDKRPFTDKAVVYRHRDTLRGLEAIAGLLREPDALHDSEVIRDLVLLDLPDFDSFQHENRRTVLEILPALDAVVWVVSPEKYADAAFYELTRQVSINPDNFSFVLNKSDELIVSDGPDPHLRLKDVLGDLTFRLKHETGLDEPRIFSLSAAHEIHSQAEYPVLEHEFRRFRDFLMVRRDVKEIASVKTANLVEKARLLLRDLNEAIQPEDKAGILDHVRRIEEEAKDFSKPTSLTTAEQERALARTLQPILMAEDRSIASVKTAMRLLGSVRSEGKSSKPGSLERVFREIGETFLKHWSADLNHETGRVDSELLLSFQGRQIGLIGERSEDLMKDSLSRAQAAFEVKITRTRQSLSGTRSAWRPWAQKLVLWFPVAILAIRLTGERATSAFLDFPSLSNALKLLLSLLVSIFSSDGLIGLISLMICELVLVWYLAAARIGKIERSSNRLARFGVNRLINELSTATRKVRSERKDMLLNIERGLARLAVLNDALQVPKLGEEMGPSNRSITAPAERS